MRMMTDREVWLKAMAIVEVHGTMEAAPIVDTILDVLGDEPHKNDWARVAAAVDVILEGQAQ
jgi:hypothetical protein